MIFVPSPVIQAPYLSADLLWCDMWHWGHLRSWVIRQLGKKAGVRGHVCIHSKEGREMGGGMECPLETQARLLPVTLKKDALEVMHNSINLVSPEYKYTHL